MYVCVYVYYIHICTLYIYIYTHLYIYIQIYIYIYVDVLCCNSRNACIRSQAPKLWAGRVQELSRRLPEGILHLTAHVWHGAGSGRVNLRDSGRWEWRVGWGWVFSRPYLESPL